jgi:small subunit ribosomal protein S20
VAHSLSAKKRIRQNEKHKARNKARKVAIKDQTKLFSAALHAGDFSKAEVELKTLTSKLDRTAAKHTIHKKAASRKRSRLTKRLNAAKVAKASGASTTAAKPKGKKAAGKTAAKKKA